MGEIHPVPKNCILATRQTNTQGYVFSLWDRRKENKIFPMVNNVYSHPQLCKVEGTIHFAYEKNKPALSLFISSLVNSEKGKTQRATRTEDFYLLHDSSGQLKSKRNVLALVKPVSPTQLVLILLNEDYKKPTMDYFYLDYINH